MCGCSARSCGYRGDQRGHGPHPHHLAGRQAMRQNCYMMAAGRGRGRCRGSTGENNCSIHNLLIFHNTFEAP